MSNEDLPKEGIHSTVIDMNAAANMGGRGALLFSAYMEDRTKWEESKQDLRQKIFEHVTELKVATKKDENEFSLVKFIYNKILRKPSPATTKLMQARQSLELLTKKMIEIANSEPSIDRYEIAMIGNNLFKPR
jgi:hypothetical protein